MTEKVEHYQIGTKYRIVFEQAASTKGVLGFKVESNGDDLLLMEADAITLLNFAKEHAPLIEIK